MGKAQRDKGLRIERKIVHLYQDAGIPAERVPLSGSAGGSFGGDLVVKDSHRVEVKGRANGEGFALLERWLGNHDWLVLHRDRAHPLVLMTWEQHITLLKGQRDAT